MEKFIGGFTLMELMEWRQAQRDTETERDRETDRQRDRQTERQTDRETDRQRDRQTDKERDRQREIVKYSWQRDKYVQGERER
jgi:hypothetical protein